MIRRSWLTTIVVAAFAVLVAVSFLFADAKADHAVAVAKQEAIRSATAEAARADDAICRIAATNRHQSIVLLEAFEASLQARPNPDPVRQAENVALVDRLLADATAPFPQPCTRYSPAP